VSWKPAFSAGCFGAYPDFDDPARLAALLSQVRCDLVEMPAYGSWPGRRPEALAPLLAAGKTFFAVHSDKRIGRLVQTGNPDDLAGGLALLREAAAFGGALGCRLLDLHLWGAGADMSVILAALPAVLDVAGDGGLEFCVEFVPGAGEPLPVIGELAQRGVSLSLDTEFLSWFGPAHAILADVLEAFGGLVRNVHVRDFDGRPYDDAGRRRYCRFGEGCLDIAGVKRALSASGWDGYVTAELGPVATEEVNRVLGLLAA